MISGRFYYEHQGVEKRRSISIHGMYKNIFSDKSEHFSGKQLVELTTVNVVEYMMNQKKCYNMRKRFAHCRFSNG
jgi:hypothetical protein